MSDLEKYMNSDDALDPLIQAALIHYQFETTHPFLDGNGRVARITLDAMLRECGVNGSGLWSNAANWLTNVVADGSGIPVDFFTVAQTTTTTVTLDTAAFAAPVGTPGQVSATVTCALRLDDLGLPGVTGTKTITATMSSPLDTYRGR